MKLLTIIGFILFSVVGFSQENSSLGNSQELVDKNLKLLTIEKALIEFETEGQPGDTLILAFDRYGWRQSQMEFGEKLYYGIKTQINTRKITDGEVTIDLNLKDKKGQLKTDFTLPKLAAYKDTNELFEARMAKLQATKTGSETMLDRECQIWTYQSRGKQFQVWAWEGIILKHRSPSGTITATSIDTNPELDEMLFTVPNDCELVRN